jgi:hypothetical protein
MDDECVGEKYYIINIPSRTGFKKCCLIVDVFVLVITNFGPYIYQKPYVESLVKDYSLTYTSLCSFH